MLHAPPLARPAQPRAASSATVMRHHPGTFLRKLAARRPAVAHATSSAEVNGFSDSSLSEFKVAIMGDLHLAPEQMHLFHAARAQLVANMSGPDGKPHPGARVVQLGDLGHSKHKSGSTSCFEFAKSFISGFGVPSALVLGNHDLEGEEFETDADNLAAWRATMGQPHYWSARLGPALLVGLSTVRYRSNYISHHEVYIDDEQQAWLEELLEANRGTPTVIFTHAPPMGCGLKVIQEVHVKNRCAWLNHSDDPARFMRLLARHRETVRLWFSGHFHLSHNYPDSITTVGPTAFVQTGVIGTCNRDGYRHSRLLTGDAEGFKLYTVDHEATGGAAPRLDLQQRWDDLSPPKPMLPPEDELLCDPSAGGWLCSKLECHVGEDNAFVHWVGIGQRTILALQDDLLVEYDMGTAAPIGLVGLVPHGSELKLLTADGSTSSSEDGSDIAEIKIVDAATGEVRSSHPRNQWGGFFQIYQPNKWRLKKAKEAAAKEAAAVPAS